MRFNSTRALLTAATLSLLTAPSIAQTIQNKHYYWDKRIGCSAAYAHTGFQADTQVEDMRKIQTSGFFRVRGEKRERLKIDGWAVAKGYLFGFKKEGFRFDGNVNLAEGIVGQNSSYYVSSAPTYNTASGNIRFSIAGNTLLNRSFSGNLGFSPSPKRIKMFGLVYNVSVGPVPMSVGFDVHGVCGLSGGANVLWSTPRVQMNASLNGYIEGDGRCGVGISGVVGFGMGLSCKLIDSTASVNCEASSSTG